MAKRKMNIYGTCFVLICILSALSGLYFLKSSNEKDVIEMKIVSEKVKFEGIDVVSSETTSEIAEKINAFSEDYARLIVKLDNAYDEEGERVVDENMSLEEYQALLKQHRQEVKEYYTRSNAELVAEMDLSAFDIEFTVDSYAPFVFGKFDRKITSDDIDNVYRLAEADQIEMVYIRTNEQVEEHLDSVVEAIDATDFLASDSDAGAGIVIGIAEYGIVDTNYAFFDNVNVTRRMDSYATADTHASLSAMCALTVAPGASILSVHLLNDESDEFEWLLDNGANVINMSFACYSSANMGGYSSLSAYCDSLVRDTWVTLTCAAGNHGESHAYVNPPNGYNMLTVGNCTDAGIRRGSSSYEETYAVDYPSFLAPGTEIVFPQVSNPVSGTSLSAPVTAGVVAVLMKQTPSLVRFPERVKATLIASTARIAQYARSSGLHDEAGSGMLNLPGAVVASPYCVNFSISSDQVGEFVNTKQIYLSSGKRIRIAFTSIVNATSTSGTDIVTDYDLYLYNSSDQVVGASKGMTNVEFIDYVAEEGGYYYIKIKQFGEKKTDRIDYCAFSYLIH